jgi:hypothetical protein
MKQVRESKAGQTLSAWIVLNKRHQEIAHIHASRNEGVCQVDIYQYTDDALNRSLKVLQQTYRTATVENVALQQSRTRFGNGLTLTLAGLIVDGHTFAYEGEQTPEMRNLMKAYRKAMMVPMLNAERWTLSKKWNQKAQKIGAYLIGYTEGRGYESCLPWTGLDGLKARGYRVIQVL